jgi:hypothetical protein
MEAGAKLGSNNGYHQYYHQGPLAALNQQMPRDFADYLVMHAEICDGDTYVRLQIDLVEHLSRLKGDTSVCIIRTIYFNLFWKYLFVC